MTSAPVVVFTQSELSAFRTCRKRWSFRYMDGLVPLARPRALTVGTILHAGVAEMYRALGGESASVEAARLAGERAVDVLVSEWVRETSERPVGEEERGRLLAETTEGEAEARSALRLYAEAFLASDAERYEVLGVEQAFDVPFGDGRSRAKMIGKIDLVLRDRASRTIWLGEHKTTKGDASLLDARVDVDGQVRAYLYALSRLYPKEAIGGVMLNVVRKQGPRQPKLNKDDTVSVAACDTTRAIYVEALREQEARGKPATEKQRAFCDSLTDSTARWVTRSEHVLTSRDVMRWVDEAVADVRLIRASEHPKRKMRLPITRNPASCTLPWSPPCAYRSVCVDETSARVGAEFTVVERYSELRDEALAEEQPTEVER